MDSGNGSKKVGPNGKPEVGSGKDSAIIKDKKNIRTLPTRSSARLRNQWLPYEVFNNELLRKKIVDYAIFSGENKKENRITACSLRLVGKTWNETVIKLLHKRQEPLFEVSDYYYAGERCLERFCSTFADSTPVNDSIPPFSLEINNVDERSLTDMYNLLIQCGSGLVQLTTRMITQGEPCQRQFPNLSLPRLGKLNVIVTLGQEGAQGVTFGEDGGETFGSALFNALREATTNNVDFKMTLDFGRLGLAYPEAETADESMLESIAMPTNITRLTLNGDLRNADVEVLARKSLPGLTSLTLDLDFEFLSKGSIYRLLDNYRASLRSLFIDDYICDRSRQPILNVHFPIMYKLEEFVFSSATLELDPGLVSLALPKLRTLRLRRGVGKLQKWTGHTKFTSVVNLQFALGSFCSTHYTGMETMQGVNYSFPNVRNLDLNFVGGDTSGLTYLFQEMTQLTDLTLKYWNWEEVNPNFWDAVLTGVSVETIAESRRDSGFWERFDMNREGAQGSIKNLQELTSLTLNGVLQDENIGPLISDVTFKRALLKMPKLRKLYLLGGFVASAEMTEEWRNGGRSLEYTMY